MTVLAIRVGGRHVGLDMDDRRPDELGDDLHNGRLSFEYLDAAVQFPPQFGAGLGPDVDRPFKPRRQGRGRLRRGCRSKTRHEQKDEANAECDRSKEQADEEG
jgi:hypothetical protein